MAFYSLEHVADRLRTHVKVSAVFNCVNTRLILQTGVNLKKIDPAQNRDNSVVQKVATALARMGIRIEEGK